MQRLRKHLLLNFISLAFLFLAGCAGRNQFMIENDFVAPGGNDDNYTSGLSFTHSPDEDSTITVGQQFYTPDDLRDPNPIPDDRPYAGWLGVGYNKHNIQKTASGNDSKESIGGRVGCTGVCSGAETLQKFIHDDLDSGTYPEGWHNQIATEPTVGVNYEYLYRPLQIATGQNFTFDTILNGRGDLGTEITRGTLGSTFRFGYKLPNDFGPDVVEPTAEFEAVANRPFRAYLFARADGKATLYNIFIDNHLFNEGTELDLETWGTDLATGFMFHFQRYRVGFQFIWRSKEFAGDSSHEFGSLTLGWDI